MDYLTKLVAWAALVIGIANWGFGLVDANDINAMQDDIARFELRLDTIASQK